VDPVSITAHRDQLILRCFRRFNPTLNAVTEQNPSRRLAVHKFVCANCGAVKTIILLRKQSEVAPPELGVKKIDLPERMAACSGGSCGLSQCKSAAVFQIGGFMQGKQLHHARP
jgi:hypothetical protein